LQDDTSMQDRASMSVFHQLQRMLRIRASQPAFAENKIDLSDLEDPALLLYRKGEGEQEIWVAANFSEQVRTLPSGSLTSTKDTVEHHTYTDLLSNELVSRGDGIPLGPCQIRWLVANRLG
jgi:glycosidase